MQTKAAKTAAQFGRSNLRMLYNPKAIKNVVLDGHSLTLESFVAVSRFGATVELAPSALEAMKKSRALAE